MSVERLLDDYELALEQIEQARIDAGLAELEKERDELKAKIDQIVLERGNYEGDKFKITRVQAFKRTWNIDKLEKILPRPLYRKVIKVEVDSAKIDELVRAEKIDLDTIEPAFEQTPNKAYAKWTRVSADSGTEEAASLAAKLG